VHPARSNTNCPKPKVILICSPKGGSGKSTLARAMLVRAAQTEHRTLGLDFDPQRTLAKWFARRPDAVRTNIRVEPINFDDWSSWRFALMKEVDPEGRLMAEVVVLDTPPAVEMALGTFKAIVEMADMVLVPTQPSNDDIESTEPWMRAVKQVNPHAAFVLSRINKQAKSTVEAQAKLLKAGRLCPMSIPDSEEVKRAHDLGCTVLDLSGVRTDVPQRFEGVYDFVAQEIGL
jgi:chromosome partitioning protein